MIRRIGINKWHLFYWLLFMVAVALSFPKYSLTSQFLIAFSFLGLFFTNSFAEKKKLLSKNRYAFLSISILFYLSLFGVFYTNGSSGVLTELLLKIPLLILPLILFSIPLETNTFYQIYRFFSYGVVAASLSALLKALYFKYNNMGDYLFYHEFEMFTGKHSTYFALFLVLAFLYFYRTIIISKKKKWINLLPLLFLILMIYVVSNRISLLSLIIGIVTYTFPLLQLKKRIIFVLAIVLGFMFMLNTPYFKKRFSPNYLKTNKLNEINLRKLHWQAVIETIAENNILLGAGTEGNRDNLYQKYKKYHYFDAYIFKYNAHNQFLETALDYGLFGLFVLLIAFGYQFKILWRSKNYFLLAVYLSILTFMMTESLLERQSGIITFSLFVSLLLITARKDNLSE